MNISIDISAESKSIAGQIDQLLQDVGQERTRHILTTFLRDSTDGINILASQLPDGNAHDIRSIAHKLKGACSVLGANNLAQAFIAFGMAIKSNNLDDAITIFETIETAFVEIKICIEEHIITLNN